MSETLGRCCAVGPQTSSATGWGTRPGPLRLTGRARITSTRLMTCPGRCVKQPLPLPLKILQRLSKDPLCHWTQVGDEVKGNVRSSNGFTFLQVFEAGHMVRADTRSGLDATHSRHAADSHTGITVHDKRVSPNQITIVPS